MKFLIKVCGVTTPEDAEFVSAAGVDAIGLNFWRGSKRFVEDARAREIIDATPKGVLRVGVFVNAHPLVVTETVADLKLDRVQLHGDEKVGSWTDLPAKQIIRAIRVYDEASMKDALAWDPWMFIYDAHTEGFGGGGVPANWGLIASAARHPYLLAGGLTPENVGEAIRLTRPDGVDVATGIESKVGIKDRDKVQTFIQAARAAATELGLPPK